MSDLVGRPLPLLPQPPMRLLAWFDENASPETKKYGGHIHVNQGPDGQGPNSVLSRTTVAGVHLPILDDDRGLFHVIPSSTPGHQHVYINQPLEAEKWIELLKLLAEVNIVDPKWAKASIEQGTATLRMRDHPKK